MTTLSKLTLRICYRFSILLAQNDRLVPSFRLRHRSTSGLCEKFLSHQKCLSKKSRPISVSTSHVYVGLRARPLSKALRPRPLRTRLKGTSGLPRSLHSPQMAPAAQKYPKS